MLTPERFCHTKALVHPEDCLLFLSPSLDRFDGLQRSLIESICNIQLSDTSWLQASLPINSGGLGIMSAAMLAPSAYLASAAGSASISQAILSAGMTPSLPSIQAQALVSWGKLVDQSVDPATGVAATKQKTWDSLVVESCFSCLLNQQAANPRERAWLQTCSQKESGAWFTLHQSAPSDCGCAMQQFVLLLVFDLVLIYVLLMTAPIVEGR